MKARPDEELDEARLQALFERTAELPSGPLLTKLAARAADIPPARRRRFWIPLRFALPATAVVALGLVALVVPREGDGPGAPSNAPLALAVAAPPSALAPPVDPDEPEAEELADWIDFTDEGDELSLDPMHGPASDAELDTWLVATAALLDEGG
jgi:hypothetical protein